MGRAEEVPMPRENAYDKGRRYLIEGRPIIHHLDEHNIEGPALARR
jgi:hypothetical protein